LHSLLERQLNEAFGGALPSTPGLSKLIAAVSAAYEANDDDRGKLQRSIEQTSLQLVDRNQRLEHDLLEIKRLELELRQTDKLRAVGQLASGIAHEINTPIQFAGDSVHFLRGAFNDLVELTRKGETLAQAVEAGADSGPALAAYKSAVTEADPDYLLEELPKAFEQTVEGLKRVAQIVMAMKEFGRPDQREKILADINRCVHSTLTVAHNELKYAADIQLELADLRPVPCYPGQLSQVILNLLVNAAHAVSDRFGEGGRGRICVRTWQEPDGVVVSVSDNGTGIAEELRERVFEPFFTTKSLGRGTGQGLAISRSIVVEKHGGALTFDSRVGQGTTFYVRLPASDFDHASPGSGNHKATLHG
jgi:signal transduction histidine kinase